VTLERGIQVTLLVTEGQSESSTWNDILPLLNSTKTGSLAYGSQAGFFSEKTNHNKEKSSKYKEHG
jgi:hypothetical protein